MRKPFNEVNVTASKRCIERQNTVIDVSINILNEASTIFITADHSVLVSILNQFLN